MKDLGVMMTLEAVTEDKLSSGSLWYEGSTNYLWSVNFIFGTHSKPVCPLVKLALKLAVSVSALTVFLLVIKTIFVLALVALQIGRAHV